MPTAVMNISSETTEQEDFTRGELDAMYSDDTWLDQPGIVKHTGYKIGSVKLWRGNGIKAEERGDPAGVDELPPPDQTVGGKPMWRASTINLWGVRVGRRKPGGRWVKVKPPGRPRQY